MIRLVAVISLMVGAVLAFGALLSIVASTQSANTILTLAFAALIILFAGACLIVGTSLLQAPTPTILRVSFLLGAVLTIAAVVYLLFGAGLPGHEAGTIVWAVVAALSATAGILTLVARRS